MIVRLGPHTRQFQGRTYRRDPASKWSSNRKYFKPTIAEMRQGLRPLHIEVWKHYRGPIPAGFHVHHRKGNTNRNRVRDLKLVAEGAHRLVHRVTDLEARRAHLARIRPVRGSSYHAKGLVRRARRKRRK